MKRWPLIAIGLLCLGACNRTIDSKSMIAKRFGAVPPKSATQVYYHEIELNREFVDVFTVIARLDCDEPTARRFFGECGMKLDSERNVPLSLGSQEALAWWTPP